MASLLAAFLLSAKGQGLKVPQPYSSSTALGGVGPATAHTPTLNSQPAWSRKSTLSTTAPGTSVASSQPSVYLGRRRFLAVLATLGV